MRENILTRLKLELPKSLTYHDIHHTLSVEKAAIHLCALENLSEMDTLLLRTAILYHDSGFIIQYTNNEKFAKEMAEQDLPNFGYTNQEIDCVIQIIRSTEKGVASSSKLDDIMSDSDHDYFGREDYFEIADKLRVELAIFERKFSEIDWIDFQLNYLKGRHKYLTESANRLRNSEKQKRIDELIQKRTTLLSQ